MASQRLAMMHMVLGLLLMASVHAQQIREITGFSQITGASFYDAPSGNVLSTPSVGSILVTPRPLSGYAVFSGTVAPSQDAPGDGTGFASDPSSSSFIPFVIFDFSQPVAAFGASLVHFQNGSGNPYTFPVTVQVFDGSGGTGNLLGTTTDLGGAGSPGFILANFRGLWSSSLNIRSAVISATS